MNNENRNLLAKYLRHNGWVFQTLSSGNIKFDMSSNNGRLDCLIINTEDSIVMLSLFPIKVPDAKKEKVSEFISRANYGLEIGNLEIDFEDGEVRFRTYLMNQENIDFNKTTFDKLVKYNLEMSDRYLLSLIHLLYTESTPENEIDILNKK